MTLTKLNEKGCRVTDLSRPPPQPRLVLASESERRRDLLAQIGVVPDLIEPAYVDETVRKGESPRSHAKRLADEKTATVAARHNDAIVLGADTLVSCGQRILPKAETPDQAKLCLNLLSGRRHRVVSAVNLTSPGGMMRTRVVETAVRFKRLSSREIKAYLESGEWLGKTGGYAIQGRAAIFVAWLGGSYSNVVGLPLFETHSLLLSAGVTVLRPSCD